MGGLGSRCGFERDSSPEVSQRILNRKILNQKPSPMIASIQTDKVDSKASEVQSPNQSLTVETEKNQPRLLKEVPNNFEIKNLEVEILGGGVHAGSLQVYGDVGRLEKRCYSFLKDCPPPNFAKTLSIWGDSDIEDHDADVIFEVEDFNIKQSLKPTKKMLTLARSSIPVRRSPMAGTKSPKKQSSDQLLTVETGNGSPSLPWGEMKISVIKNQELYEKARSPEKRAYSFQKDCPPPNFDWTLSMRGDDKADNHSLDTLDWKAEGNNNSSFSASENMLTYSKGTKPLQNPSVTEKRPSSTAV